MYYNTTYIMFLILLESDTLYLTKVEFAQQYLIVMLGSMENQCNGY